MADDKISDRDIVRAAIAEAFGPAFGPPESLERIAKRHERAIDAHTDKIFAALAASGRGIVPREPTAKMQQAAYINSGVESVNARQMWRSMFDAQSE